MTLEFGNTPEIIKYRGIVVKLAQQYTNGDNFDDLLQAGMCGMYHAISTYSPRRKCKLSTYIYIHARKKIQIAKNSEVMVSCHPQTAKKHNLSVCSLDQLEDREDAVTPYDNLVAKEDEMETISRYKLMWSILNRKFDSKARKIIIDYFVHGLSINKLSKQYRVNAYNVITEAQAMVREGMSA